MALYLCGIKQVALDWNVAEGSMRRLIIESVVSGKDFYNLAFSQLV